MNMDETRDDSKAGDVGPPGGAPPPSGGGAVEVIPLVYDFIAWMAPKLSTYPKVHRFTLGDRTMTVMLQVLDGLIVARYDRASRAAALRDANLGLDRLRYLVRLGRDLQCISLKEYEHAARSLVEAGKHVGGWLRQAQGGGRAGGRSAPRAEPPGSAGGPLPAPAPSA